MATVKVKEFEAELLENKFWPYAEIYCSKIKIVLDDGHDFYMFLPTSMLEFS